MMLSSAGQRGDAMRCRELGIAAYLTKPIRQAELMDAILTALGNAPEAKTRPALVTRHSLRESQAELQVLLAEDNAVNQLVAVALAQKRFGHYRDRRGQRQESRWKPGKRRHSTRS